MLLKIIWYKIVYKYNFIIIFYVVSGEKSKFYLEGPVLHSHFIDSKIFVWRECTPVNQIYEGLVSV